MQLKIKKDSILPIYLLLVGFGLIQIFRPLNLMFFVSIGTWTIVAATVIALVLWILRAKIDIMSFIPLFVLLIICVLSFIVSFNWNYNTIVRICCFLQIPIFLSNYQFIDSKKIKLIIYLLYVALSIYYILLSFTNVAFVFYSKYGLTQAPFLTLGFGNPNETAIHIGVCFFVLSDYLLKLKRKALKALIIIDLLILMYLIILTQNRSVLLSIFVFILLNVIFRKRAVPVVLRYVFLIMPVVFVVFSYVTKDLGLMVFGEALDTGRIDIFDDVFVEYSFLEFFVGDMVFAFENLHNAYVTIFACTGLIGILTFCWIMNYKIKYIQRNPQGDNCALISFLCIFLISSVEASLLTVGSAFAVEVMSLYYLCLPYKIKGDIDEDFTN